MKAILHADIVLETQLLNDGVLLIENDRITKHGKYGEVDIPKNAEVIDAAGNYLGPGFVDIHVHGGGGTMFYRDPENAAAHFLKHGETTVLATLYYDLTNQEFYEAILRVQEAMKTKAGASIAGFYMEGPYLNPKYGASPEKNHWRGAMDPADYTAIVGKAGTDAKVWAIAPEREGIEDFLKTVKAVDPNAVISVAHSEATPTQIERLKSYGITLQTHCTNATGTVASLPGTRRCGPDEACFADDEMYAEVICDSLGIHVDPEMLRFLLKIKGKDKLVLITDSFVTGEENPPHLASITDLSFDANGNLCGSLLTMDAALKNLIAHTGVSLCDAFLMASRNPAKVIGMDKEIGTIAVGKRADLVLLDRQYHVKKVFFRGNEVC